MKKFNSKLSLNKETITRLNESDMDKLRGGQMDQVEETEGSGTAAFCGTSRSVSTRCSCIRVCLGNC